MTEAHHRRAEGALPFLILVDDPDAVDAFYWHVEAWSEEEARFGAALRQVQDPRCWRETDPIRSTFGAFVPGGRRLGLPGQSRSPISCDAGLLPKGDLLRETAQAVARSARAIYGVHTAPMRIEAPA